MSGASDEDGNRLGVGSALLVQRQELAGRREHGHRAFGPELQSRQGPAEADVYRLIVAELADREARPGDIVDPDHGQLGSELVERVCVVEREATDPGASERGEVAANP